MKNLFIFGAFMVLLMGACCKEITKQDTDCLDQFISNNQLELYDGQELGCKFHYFLYELDGEYYLLYNSHCADMVASPITCAGDPIDFTTLGYFNEHAENLGIYAFVP